MKKRPDNAIIIEKTDEVTHRDLLIGKPTPKNKKYDFITASGLDDDDIIYRDIDDFNRLNP